MKIPTNEIPKPEKAQANSQKKVEDCFPYPICSEQKVSQTKHLANFIIN